MEAKKDAERKAERHGADGGRGALSATCELLKCEN